MNRYSKLGDSELTDLRRELEIELEIAVWWEWTYFLTGFEAEYQYQEKVADYLESLLSEVIDEVEYRVYQIARMLEEAY